MPRTSSGSSVVLLALSAASVLLGVRSFADGPEEPGEGAVWTSHTFARVAASLAAAESEERPRLWVGTQGGGVLELDVSRKTFRSLTRSESCLPDDLVNDVAHDPSTGDLWAATDRGAARLPRGAGTFEVLDATNSPLASPVLAVAVDFDGSTWFGTFDQGAFRLKDGEWMAFDTRTSGLSDDLVTSIAIDRDGNKWFGVWGDGVDRFDGDTWTNFDPGNTATPGGLCGAVTNPPEELGLISFFVRPLGVDPRTGDVWFRNEDDGFCLLNGVSRFDGERWETFTRANSGLVSNQVRAVAFDSEGAVWFGTAQGASRFDGERWETFDLEDGLADLNVLSAATVGGELWLGSFTGLSRLTDEGFVAVRPPGLPAGHVPDLAVLGEGETAWFATGSGAARLEGGTWEVFDAASGLPSSDARAVAFDAEGRLWAGTRSRGAARFDGARWEVFDRSSSGIGDDAVAAIALDLEGGVWFGSPFGGASRLLGGEWSVFTPRTSGLPSFDVREVAVAPGGSVWFATTAGLARLDGEVWTTCTTEDGLPSDFVTAVAFGAGGEVWAGTFSQGIARREGDAWISVESPPGAGGASIRALAFEEGRGLWAGTWGSGIALLESGEWNVFGRSEGLVNDRVLDIEIDGRGRKWIATDSGVSVLETAAPSPPFLRGDATCDGRVDITDAIATFGFLFLGEDPPCCLDAADASDQGSVNLSSGVFTLGFLFLGSPPPPPPGPFSCGEDPTPDGLDCAGAPACPDGFTGERIER